MKRENNLAVTVIPGVDKTQVLLDGDLNIRNAAAIKGELLHVLNGLNNMEVVIGSKSRLDVSVMQLLVAFQKSAAALENKLSFRVQFPDYITEEIRKCGFAGIFLTDSEVVK